MCQTIINPARRAAWDRLWAIPLAPPRDTGYEDMWESLTYTQQAALLAARDAGTAGLTSETHPAAFTEAPSLIDRGYLAEVAAGTLTLTPAGEAILPSDEPSTTDAG